MMNVASLLFRKGVFHSFFFQNMKGERKGYYYIASKQVSKASDGRFDVASFLQMGDGIGL